MNDSERKITSYYKTWSPEDIEFGETDNKGEHETQLIEIDEIDKEDGNSIVDVAVEHLIDCGVSEPSSSSFHPGIWYTTYGEQDFKDGSRTNFTYHLKGFTSEEERMIYEELIRNSF